MTPNPRLLALLCAALLAGCASTPPAVPVAVESAPPPAAVTAEVVDNFQLDALNATLWARTASEASATHLQAYAMARHALDQALADPSWTAAVEQSGDFAAKPPAIIVDVDETVLDTSDETVERMRSGQAFSPANWNAYVQRENATPIPGALAFLRYAASKGVTVYYVSNRVVASGELLDEVEPTRRNLAKFGFPNTDSSATFFFRDSARGWHEKSPRRAEVAKTHRIVMLVGDNLHDFIDIDQSTRAKRDRAVEQHAAWLGTRWIVIANPVYGSWETIITGRNSAADARRTKLEAIGVPTPVADHIARGGFER